MKKVRKILLASLVSLGLFYTTNNVNAEEVSVVDALKTALGGDEAFQGSTSKTGYNMSPLEENTLMIKYYNCGEEGANKIDNVCPYNIVFAGSLNNYTIDTLKTKIEAEKTKESNHIAYTGDKKIGTSFPKKVVTLDNESNGFSWVIDGNNITGDVELAVTVGTSTNQAEIANVIPTTKKDPLYLDFKHSGALPTGTKAKVRVAGKYTNGQRLTLYYYNPTTKKLEEPQSNLIVNDGYVEFSLTHCSEYVLVANKPSSGGGYYTSSTNTTTNGTTNNTTNSITNDDEKIATNPKTSAKNIIGYSILELGTIISISYILIRKNQKKRI